MDPSAPSAPNTSPQPTDSSDHLKAVHLDGETTVGGDLVGGDKKIGRDEFNIKAERDVTVIIRSGGGSGDQPSGETLGAIPNLEPPYGAIWKLWNKGRIVPFLGAGASLIGRLPNQEWNAQDPPFMPNGTELSNLLADEATYPSNDKRERSDLSKVSSYYNDLLGRRNLRARLRELFNREASPATLHEMVASIPVPQVIITTNYDGLIERAFHNAQKPYDLVIHPTDRRAFANAVLWQPYGADEPKPVKPNELYIDLATTTVIYKMHGTVDAQKSELDSFVITEDDYVEFLSRMTNRTAMPDLFMEYFYERSFLFLGYSLQDWTLRVILKNLHKQLAQRAQAADEQEPTHSWAIQFQPTEVERRLWERRNVSIFDLTLQEFVANLQQWRTR